MFRDNLTRIGQICIPYKFVQSGCIPPKIKCEILAHKKGSQTTRQVRRLSRLLKLQTNGTTGPPGVNDDGSRFPRKKNPLQKRFFPFFFFHLDRSVERWGGQHNNDQSCQKQRKNPWQKWKKNWKMCWGARQWIDRQLSELRFEATVNVFVSRLA